MNLRDTLWKKTLEYRHRRDEPRNKKIEELRQHLKEKINSSVDDFEKLAGKGYTNATIYSASGAENCDILRQAHYFPQQLYISFHEKKTFFGNTQCYVNVNWDNSDSCI